MYDGALRALMTFGTWVLKLREIAPPEVLEAAGKLRLATIETLMFVTRLHRGEQPSTGEKDALSLLWSDASTGFQPVDPTISEGCMTIALLLGSSPFVDASVAAQLGAAANLLLAAGHRYQSGE